MTSPNLFWPTNFNSDIWPYRFFQLKESTGGGAAPDYKVYKKIVAAPIWGMRWQ
jgi:hypothetical protein